MFLAARPGLIAESQHWDLIVPNCTNNDPRRGAFGKNGAKGSTPAGPPEENEGPDHRIVRAEPIIQAGGRPLSPDTFNPHCFHVHCPHSRGVTRSIRNVIPRITFAHSPVTISFPYICGAR